jgi:hypothetical protein
VRLEAVGDEVGDVLPEELDHGLLLPPHQIQPGPGAFDRVLAASDGSKENQQLEGEETQTRHRIRTTAIRIEDAAARTSNTIPKR